MNKWNIFIVVLFIIWYTIIAVLIHKSITKPTDDESYSYSIDEIEIEYEEEIMPDGIYLYYVDGSYMTVGIMTTGRVSGTNKRAGRVTFYGVTEFGDVSSSYETLFIESVNEMVFDCIGGNYSLEFQENGKLNIVQTAKYEDLGTTLSFEGNYIYLYSFDEYSYTEKGEVYDWFNYAPHRNKMLGIFV